MEAGCSQLCFSEPRGAYLAGSDVTGPGSSPERVGPGEVTRWEPGEPVPGRRGRCAPVLPGSLTQLSGGRGRGLNVSVPTGPREAGGGRGRVGRTECAGARAQSERGRARGGAAWGSGTRFGTRGSGGGFDTFWMLGKRVLGSQEFRVSTFGSLRLCPLAL